MHKYFDETSNYLKGHRDAFKAHVEEYHPNYMLHHILNTKDDRQDIACVFSVPVLMN